MSLDYQVLITAILLMSLVLALGSLAFRLWPFGSGGLGPQLADTLRVRVLHILALFLAASLMDGATVELGLAAIALALLVVAIHLLAVRN
jgi:hypothetical protein